MLNFRAEWTKANRDTEMRGWTKLCVQRILCCCSRYIYCCMKWKNLQTREDITEQTMRVRDMMHQDNFRQRRCRKAKPNKERRPRELNSSVRIANNGGNGRFMYNPLKAFVIRRCQIWGGMLVYKDFFFARASDGFAQWMKPEILPFQKLRLQISVADSLASSVSNKSGMSESSDFFG